MNSAERPSLEDLLKDVSPEKLDQPCRDGHLCETALSVTRWKSIAPFLGLTKAEEENIEKDCGENETQKIGMLRKWRERFGKKATYRKLAKVFGKLKRLDLVEELCELLQAESCSDEDGPPSTAKGGYTLNSYAEYLRGRYSTDLPAFFTLQWPPPPTHKVFNLAMIGHETIQRGPIDEEFVRLTLRGSVDDIMRRKSSIELKNLFQLDTRKRKIILIEGAPGAGKSTLAWHIVQKWASGELFQKFRVVVFVQLRDPTIQSAKSLADILPARSSNMRAELQSIMEACDGRGVLFVLDGWDEYSPGLQHSSLFQQLICNRPGEVNVHFSSLIITSRPIASGELQQYASSRVEIVGFTSTEIKKYFSESLSKSEKVQIFQDQLRERPVIEASCYLPLNAAIIVHLFLALNHTLPHTLHEVFVSLVLCCIIRHLTKEAEGGGKVPSISSLDALPPNIQEPFNNICTMAYHGVMKNKVTFSATDLRLFNLPPELSTLSLIQAVHSFTAFEQSVSYNFLHLSVQELLAAFHISGLSAAEQIQVFNDLLDQPRLAAVFRFYAAFTKLQTEGIRDIVAKVMQKQQKPLLVNLLHGLYEAQDPSLCQFVASHLKGRLSLSEITLSPMDCLVVGYFLNCVCLTTSGEFKVYLINCSLDDYRVSLLERELSKCSSSTDAQAATADGCLELYLGNNSIQAKASGDALMVNASLRMLNLHDNPVSAGVVQIAESLKHNHSLLEIYLGRCSIAEKGCKAIGDALMVNRTLQLLDLHDNPISTSVAHIAESLKHNCSLLEINLGNCDIPGRGAKAIGDALIVNKSLQVLDLSGNRISAGVAESLEHKLEINSNSGKSGRVGRAKTKVSLVKRSFEVLDLQGNPISTGVAHIAESLKHNHSLLKINLGNCGISEKGSKAIGDALMVNTFLQVLDLHDNPISAGVVHIADSLTHNHSLLEIDLSNCGLTETETESFAIRLKENNSLQTLILRRNRLSTGAAIHIAEALRFRNCLKVLDISCSNWVFNDQSLKPLASALEMNSSLEELNLSDNSAVTGVGLLALGESLKNRGLKTLRLRLPGANISDNDWKQFIVCLQENNLLTKLMLSFEQKWSDNK